MTFGMNTRNVSVQQEDTAELAVNYNRVISPPMIEYSEKEEQSPPKTVKHESRYKNYK